MAKLLSIDDRKILKPSSEMKNAVFYKDMLAFYDAFAKLVTADTESLPVFVYWNEKFSLEGICLFMKDYSAELGFETLDLSLNYLRILYYSIASYSDDEELVKRNVIEEDFENYKKLVLNNEEELASKKYELETTFSLLQSDYSKKLGTNIKNKTLQHTFNFLSIFFIIFGVFCVIVPLALYFVDKLKLIYAIIASISCIALGVILFIIFRKLSKHYNATENGSVYEMHSSKRNKEDKNAELQEIIAKLSMLSSEKYECLNSLNKILFDDSRLKFNEILKLAKEYSILSYNIKRDCLLLFKNQQKDIDEIILELNDVSKSNDASKALGEIYKSIQRKDWLMYNNLVRYAFIEKFIQVAEKSYNFELYGVSEGKTPFDVNIKGIAKEPVAFLKDSKSLFISSTIDKFIGSAYIKNQDIFRLKRVLEYNEFVNLKYAYISKFFNYNNIKEYNNLFYDKKIGKGATVPQNIISNSSKIPSLVYLKLKLIEYQCGFENSEQGEVKQLSELLFKSDAEFAESIEQEPQEIYEVDESKVPKTIFECEEIEENGIITRYKFKDSIITGYKL